MPAVRTGRSTVLLTIVYVVDSGHLLLLAFGKLWNLIWA